MLKAMRESFHHLKWILLAVVAAFIIGFVYVDMGLGGAQSGKQTDRSYAARVNGDTISFRAYNRALYFAEENYKRMYGGQFTPEMAESMGLNRQVLDSLVDQQLLLQEASRLHLTATPAEVQKRIMGIDVLAPNGQFVGADLYGQYVRQLGFSSPADFEDEIAREITAQKMESALSSAVVVSKQAAEAEYRRVSESAKVRMVVYSGAQELANVSVTPAEVDAYYKANEAKYAHGEQRDLKYLIADIGQIRSQVVAPEAQVRQRYDATRDSDFKRPEQAHILHILIKVDPSASPEVDAAAHAKADALVKQLRGGADFATLAKANSQDPSSAANGGDMGFVDKGATVDPFDQAAFSIPLNTISDPIRTKEFGYHIIKVLERRPAGYQSFEEVRSAIANQIATQMAQDQSRDEITKIAARIKDKKPASPAEFSALANDRVSSNETQWFAKNEPLPGIGANEPLSSWAFSAKIGDVSDVIGTKRGPMIAYVAGVRPAGISPLGEIRPRVEADAKAAKARTLASAKLAAAMTGASSIDAVASKLGLTAQDVNITRQGLIAGISGDTSALVEAALNTPVGQLKGPIDAGDGAVAFVVTEQKKVTPDDLAKNAPQYIDMMRQRESRNLRAALLQRLRKASKIDINQEALQQTHGTNEGA